MKNTISNWLANIAASREREVLRTLLNAIGGRLSSQATATAGLVIKAASGTLAKTGSTAFQGIANGVPVTIAASTDMPALTGLVITANKFNVACFFIDAASVVTMLYGYEGATLAAVRFPEFPDGKALVGYLVITHSATFTGGTTALDTATTVYVSPVGAFDPNIILS